ncbi:MAG TPA: C-terminal helicase domain-containing protein, partial [Allocoleopsis sp.]
NCKNQDDRPNAKEEIGVLIGSETLSVGQNLQDADYLINIDLPWNPMILEQRIGRIDRPKSHSCENIYIYYANSESQLLRQASRLNNLHKKLIGDLEKKSGIPNINNLEDLGASIYGDTLFDDEILPGYIEFLNSLVKARKMEQESFQEKVYQNQKSSVDYYSENEILHSEELRKLYERLGENYEVNPITIGQDNFNQEMSLVGIKIDYFDPNGKLIKERQEKIYWNSKSGDEEGIGKLIDMGFKTPEKSEIISTKEVINRANILYEKLVELKGKLSKDLAQWETGENQAEKSERFNQIQKRLNQIKVFPKDINSGDVRKMLKKLTQGKGMKKVQKILFNYTDGVQSKLNDAEFIIELIK